MNELYCSETRVETLKRRARRCCCKYCGGPLTLKRIIFNDFEDARIEIYCEHCERIEYGIEPEIYQSAQNFVDHLEFNYYNDLEQNARTRRMNVAKVAEIMAWGYKNTGLLTAEGFTVPLNCSDSSLNQCLILTEDELEQLDNGEPSADSYQEAEE
ncbi:MAG: hypothetical protein ACI3U1_01810 [Peptococcaceae bacterium]